MSKALSSLWVEIPVGRPQRRLGNVPHLSFKLQPPSLLLPVCTHPSRLTPSPSQRRLRPYMPRPLFLVPSSDACFPGIKALPIQVKALSSRCPMSSNQLLLLLLSPPASHCSLFSVPTSTAIVLGQPLHLSPGPCSASSLASLLVPPSVCHTNPQSHSPTVQLSDQASSGSASFDCPTMSRATLQP